MFEKIHLSINSSIRRRLFCYFIILTIVPITIVSVIINLVSYNKLINHTTDATIQTVEDCFNNMEKTFEESYNVGQSIIKNIKIQEIMRQNFKNDSDKYSADLEGGMQLSSINVHRPEILGIYVLGNNNSCLKSNIFPFKMQDFSKRNWYDQIINSYEPVWFSSKDGSFVVSSNSDSIISLGIPFVNLANGNKNGVVIVDLSNNVIENFTNKRIEKFGFYSIVDSNNEIILNSSNSKNYSNLEKDVLKNISKNKTYKTKTIKTKKALIVSKESPTTHWKLIGVVPMNEIKKTSMQILLLTFILVLFCIVISILLSYYFSKSFTKPILELERKMKNVRNGDFSVRLKETGNDEFTGLTRTFNSMVNQTSDLINLIYEKQESQRKLEFKALQAQINPHFLYNSLDSIMWLLKMQKYSQAKCMLENMIILFKISLSKGSEIIPISREISHLRSYLEIQKIRYDKKFDYSITYNQNIDAHKTLKLLLQPLVENSIYHGISIEKPHININITIEQINSDIIFKVIDDGIGMSCQKLEELQNTINSDGTDLGSSEIISGYGLHNVNHRIKLYAGDSYGLYITSVENEGTTMIIKIPSNL